MNKRNFYVVLVCVIIAALGFSFATQLRMNTINEQVCPNGNCETIIKEYEYLPIEDTYSEDQNPTIDEHAETVEHITGLAGDEVQTDDNKIYNRSVFAAGNNVTTKQLDVNGMIFAAGRKVKTTTKQQSIAAAGETVVMDSITHQEAFLAGKNIEFTENSSVRDLFAAGETITIRGVVRGDIFTAGSKVVFENATVLGDVNVDADAVEFKGESLVHGTLKYNSHTKVQNLDKSKVGGITSFATPNYSSDVLYIIFTCATAVCSMVASVSIFVVFLNRISNKQYEKLVASNTAFKDLGLGFVALLVVPCVLIMLLGFDFLVFINVVLILSLVIALLCSVAIAAVLLGRFVSSKILKSKNASVYQVAMLGAITFAIISVIPVFGGIFNFMLIIAGFGYIIGEVIHNFVSRNKKPVSKKN